MRFDVAAWAWVCQVPRGKVVTYGQVATYLGSPRAARAVGYAMFRCHDDVPWHRVVNSKGEISEGGHLHRPARQRELLEAEGVVFNKVGQIDLRQFRWQGPAGPTLRRRKIK